MNLEFKKRLKAELTDSQRKDLLDSLIEFAYLDTDQTVPNNANESFLSDLKATAISVIKRVQNDQRQTASCKNVDWNAINKLPHNMEADKVLY